MPHVIVKMYAGKSAEQKLLVADEVTKAIVRATGHGAEAVSVSVEDVSPADWTDKVYRPDIIDKPDSLLKKPGYGPARSHLVGDVSDPRVGIVRRHRADADHG